MIHPRVYLFRERLPWEIQQAHCCKSQSKQSHVSVEGNMIHPRVYLLDNVSLGRFSKPTVVKANQNRAISVSVKKYDTFRGKNLFLKKSLLGKGLSQGTGGDRRSL